MACSMSAEYGPAPPAGESAFAELGSDQVRSEYVDMNELSTITATDAIAALKRREVSSEELLDALLGRVAQFNSAINAVVAFDVDRARARARDADQATMRGESWGPLHGLSMTIKDSFETEGLVTTSGAPELAQHRPSSDAAGVAALKQAGAIVYAKTNLPLYAGDLQTFNDVYGLTRNPWDTERTTGGSSGGAGAALASGMTLLELGSDIGGSIRVPCHYNGVFGHKPTWNAVSLRGHIPGAPGTLNPGDLGVVGPMGRSVADVALALDVLCAKGIAGIPGAQFPPGPGTAHSLKGLRVALFVEDSSAPTSGECKDAVKRLAQVLADGGARIAEGPLPGPSLGEQNQLYQQLLRSATDADPAITHADWTIADEKRHRLIAQYVEFFANYDVIIAPIAPTTAFTHRTAGTLRSRTLDVDGTEIPYLRHLTWAGLATLPGLPATAVTAGRSPSGLPIGAQIIGAPWADRTTLAVAGLVESMTEGFVAPPGF